MLGNLFVLGPVIGVPVLKVLRAMARPAAAGLGMYVAVAVARLVLASRLDDVSRLLVLVLVGLLVYTGLVMIIDRNGCRDLMGLVRG